MINEQMTVANWPDHYKNPNRDRFNNYSQTSGSNLQLADHQPAGALAGRDTHGRVAKYHPGYDVSPEWNQRPAATIHLNSYLGESQRGLRKTLLAPRSAVKWVGGSGTGRDLSLVCTTIDGKIRVALPPRAGSANTDDLTTEPS